MYRNFNPNPIAARVGDCSVRALCKALGSDWETTYINMMLYGLMMCDLPSANAVWGKMLSDKGFVKRNLPLACAECYTVKDFTKDYNKGTYVIVVQGHVLTAIDGDYFDSWDSGDEVPLYYWKREEK